MIEIGSVEAIYRYPIKSMRGERIESARLGWHGIEGDRRLAFRRLDKVGGFPWLSASKVADLLLYSAVRPNGESSSEIPTHVRGPDGRELPVFGGELAAEVSRIYGGPVEMMQMRQGIFDDAFISVIASTTVAEITRLAAQPPDARRFRPNIVVRPTKAAAFQEEEWLGGTLYFGGDSDAPAISTTVRDARCAIISLDPDTAMPTPEVLKTVVRSNMGDAGVYATVVRAGPVQVGQAVFYRPNH